MKYSFDHLPEMLGQVLEKLVELELKINVHTISPDTKRNYNNQEACTYLKVCNKTLQTYRDKGMIEFSQNGRKILYTQANLDEFLKRNKKQMFNSKTK